MKAKLFPVVIITLLLLVFSAWAVAGTVNEKPKLAKIKGSCLEN